MNTSTYSNLLTKLGTATVILPYYHYADQSFFLMEILCKGTNELLEKNVDNFIRILDKRTLKVHYPLFEKVAPALEKNYRYALYKIDIQIKFPNDFDLLNKFIQDHPKINFKQLQLLVTKESLEKVNKTLDILKENAIISKEMDDTYEKLDLCNYCRNDDMKDTKLKHETELIIGADPKAFLDKVETVGLLDVRQVANCPCEDIEFPVYKIRADKDFADRMEGAINYHSIFTESVRKVIIEEEAKKIGNSMDQVYANIHKVFPNINRMELELRGDSLTSDAAFDILSNSNVEKFRFDGLEEDNAWEITTKNGVFAIADSNGPTFFKAKTFTIEATEECFEAQGDYVIIKADRINMQVENPAQRTDKFDESKYI